MDFQLHSGMLDYDPEEEERKRTAALAALASRSTPTDSAVSPGQLEIESNPMPEPDAIGALAAQNAPPMQLTPPAALRDPDELPEPEDEKPYQAAEAMAPAAEPAKGLESVARSPEMKEVAPLSSPQTPTAQSATSVAKTEGAPPIEQDPFEALMRKGEEQRAKALENLGEEPGVNGWAILADVAFNHGRSIPSILQQSESAKQHWREGRQKLLTGGADPVSQALAFDRIQTARGNLAARIKGQEHKIEQDAKKEEANKLNREGVISFITEHGASPDEVDAISKMTDNGIREAMPLLRKRFGLSDEMIGLKAKERAEVTAAGTHAQNETNARDAPLLEQSSYARGSGNYRAQAENAPNMPQTPQQLKTEERDDKRLKLAEKTAAAAEAAREDAAAARKDAQDRNWITDYGNKRLKQIDTAKLVDELDDIVADADARGEKPAGLGVEQLKEGLDKVPLGQTGRAISALIGSDEYNNFQAKADYNRKLLGRLNESVYRIDTGASGNEREEMRAAIANAVKPTATLDDIRNTLKILRTRLTSQLGGIAAAAPDLASQALSGGGINDPQRWLGHIQRPQQPTAAADPSLDPGQSVTIDPDTGDEVVEGASADPTPPKLKVTGTRNNVAPIPITPPSARDYQKMLEEDADLGVSYGR